jgi:hypothetical protein
MIHGVGWPPILILADGSFLGACKLFKIDNVNRTYIQWRAAKFLTRGSHSHPQKKSKKQLLIFSYFKFFLNTNHSKLHLHFHLALFLLSFSLCYLLLITSKIIVKTALHTRVDWTWLFSGIKSSLGSQKSGQGSSKPIPKYFCISFRSTSVASPSKISQSVRKCEEFWKQNY